MSWVETKLGECIEFSNGYAFKSKFFTENENDIPLIKGENLGKGEVLWEKSKYWKVENLNGLERFLLNAGDIVLAMDRPYVGGSLKYAMIKTSDPKSLQVQRIGRLVAKQSVINEKFLRCVISSDSFKNYVKNIQGGVGVPHISPSQIKNYEFEIPPLSTQKRLADILSVYDDLIENNLKRITLLEQAAQNIYKEWFVKLRFPGHENTPINEETGLPVGWSMKRLDEIYEFKNGFAFYTKGYSEEETPYVVVDLGNISESGDFVLSGKEKYISESLYQEKEGYYLKKYDIVVAMTDMTARLGILAKVGIIDENDKYVLNQRVGRLRSKVEYIDYCYINASLSDERFISEMHQRSKGAVQKYFNTKDIVQYMVTTPTKSIVEQFNLIYRPIIENRIVLKFQNQKLKAARSILLPRLMNRTIEL
ncbi:restriction endonuclease subunit S [Algibacter agarivorans]|uniref:Restriction endonuclease subunit S n=1 Tax=Algibacter agarivorans TaxID=1109741 RepID=A0ABP9GH95_9FLAO